MAETALASVSGTAPPAGVDAGRLADYLQATLPGFAGSLAVESASGGMSNPTFFVSTPGRRMVLRKQPAVILTANAHRIDREYRILGALAGSSIPVPAPILYCEDPEILGTPFYLMERLEGQVFWKSSLPGLAPEQRRGCYESMCRTMAAMHEFPWREGGLADFGRPGNFFERQYLMWARQWAQFGVGNNPEVDRLLVYLRENMTSSEAAAVCHGDYRTANIMFSTETSDVSGVFDWELATIGHPLADLAFNLQAWFLTPEENGGILGLDLATLGIPTAREYAALYRRFALRSEPLTAFHIAFAMMRAAVGLTGVALRNENAAVPDLEAGREARKFALAYARAGCTAIDSWETV